MPPLWQKSVYTLWFTQILSLSGFNLVLPFLPFFIQELGVVDSDEIKSWTGLINAGPGISMALVAPLWGWISDRFGRKIMILRSMLAGFIVLFLISLVNSPMQLFLLRLAQGFFTGTIVASQTLVASITPRKRLPGTLGFFSSSTFIGMTMGPVLGGYLAELTGFRTTFRIGASILLVGFVLVLLLVKEDRTLLHSNRRENRKEKSSFKTYIDKILILLFLLILLLRFSRTLIPPFLPLYIAELIGTEEGVERTVGVTVGLASLSMAFSGIFLGRLGERFNLYKLLPLYFFFAMAASIPLILVSGVTLFSVMYCIYYFSLGGLEPLLMSTTAGLIPPERRGVLFGIQTLVGSLGWAGAPLAGAAITISFSTQAIFPAATTSLFISGVVALLLWTVKRKASRSY